MKDILAVSTWLLDVDNVRDEKKQHWNYSLVFGSLKCFQCMTWPDITMAVQQCAQFCNNPMASHEETVTHIGRYLLKTQDMGLLLKPDKTRGLECYIDVD